LLSYDTINDRIITARFKGAPVNISVIQVYAPTSSAVEDEVEVFLEELQRVIDKLPKGDIAVVMGDFNAKVGEGAVEGVTGKHGLGERNEAGDRLLEFCAANDLIVSNTWFQLLKRRLYTWTSPDGNSRNQIDYFLIKKRWHSSVCATKTLPGADCGTDHELLMATIKVKLKRIKKGIRDTKYDVTKITEDYQLDIQNRFSVLSTLTEHPEELWENIKESVKLSAEACVPKVRKKEEIIMDVRQSYRNC
jgi:hypothetical protein